VFVVGQLGLREALAVDAVPSIGDVGQHEGDDERHEAHGRERKFARAAVGQGERTLQVGQRGVVGRVVEGSHLQKRPNGEYAADARAPNAATRRGENRATDAYEHQDHAEQEEHQRERQGQEIVQVFVGLEAHDTRVGIDGKAVGREQVGGEGQEEHEEGDGVGEHLSAQARRESFVVDVVEQVEAAEHTSQEEHDETEHQVPRIGHGFESVPGGGPAADGGGELVGHHVFVHHKVGAVEEGADGRAEEKWAEHAVQDEEPTIGVLAQEVAELALELIAHGLQHKAEENEHPHPVCAAEAGAVEQGEGGEESAAEGDEGGEGEFPFTAGAVDDECTFVFGAAEVENLRVGALHKHQEDDERAEETDEQPPVLL